MERVVYCLIKTAPKVLTTDHDTFEKEQRARQRRRMLNGGGKETGGSSTRELHRTQSLERFSRHTGCLKDQFVAFAKFGMPRSHDGNHITLSQSDKWLRQARVIDNKFISTTDTGILFRKMSRQVLSVQCDEYVLTYSYLYSGLSFRH